MAIKVIKPGKKEFHGFCTRCGCEFTYEISDLKLSATSNKLNCPTCGNTYYHPSERLCRGDVWRTTNDCCECVIKAEE